MLAPLRFGMVTVVTSSSATTILRSWTKRSTTWLQKPNDSGSPLKTRPAPEECRWGLVSSSKFTDSASSSSVNCMRSQERFLSTQHRCVFCFVRFVLSWGNGFAFDPMVSLVMVLMEMRDDDSSYSDAGCADL